MLAATRNVKGERWDIHILHIWVRNANDNKIVQNAFMDKEIQVVYTFEITETSKYYESKIFLNFFLILFLMIRFQNIIRSEEDIYTRFMVIITETDREEIFTNRLEQSH